MYSIPYLLMSGQPWQCSPKSLRYRVEINEETQWADEHVKREEKITISICICIEANQLSLYMM